MDKTIFQARRQKLIQALPRDAICFIHGGKHHLRNGDSAFRFRQDSDFYYLTGFESPDALLVILTEPNPKSILFHHPNDPVKARWEGAVMDIHESPDKLGVDDSFPLATLATELPNLLTQRKVIYDTRQYDITWSKQLWEALEPLQQGVRRGIIAPDTIVSLSAIIGEMRVFKSPDEIAIMQKAADISVKAHINAMKGAKEATFEYELEAILMKTFIENGARNMAYDPIVASGINACTLHYTQNNAPLQDNALILIDAGCEYHNYASDITRTFPKNGRFSPEQKLIYDIVLNAQQKAIALIQPNVPWSHMQNTIAYEMTKGLVDAEILKGSIDELIEKEVFRTYYMHGSGHFIGLDVHDAGRYKLLNEWRTLQPGMVLTVEPGLYLSPSDALDKRFWGIGIRIEDDVLVTDTGHFNLTGALPVKTDEIEALIRE